MEHLIKINLPGGFISAGDLYEILVIAANSGAKNIRFGNRQQLYFTVDQHFLEDLETEMLRAEIKFEIDGDNYPNIISSYVADAIFNQEGWLREGVYKDILDLFDYQPKLKINLVDNQQSFVPFFSGNFNFIASELNNYWYFYVRFPKSGRHYCCPSLIYSDDIPTVARISEAIIYEQLIKFYDPKEIDEQGFFRALLKKSGIVNVTPEQALKLPGFYLPYYEGFNKYSNRYWLGIYRRDELFSIDFLKEVCSLCLKNRVGQIYTTPWKSIIIKGIEPATRQEWGLILSKYHLNVRHAANELNWQIEDLNDEGLQLKKQLVREFEEADLRTYQLCFAIKTQAKSGLPGSIIIKKDKSELWDILHTKDFNPNSRDFVLFETRIEASQIAINLIRLCGQFYDSQRSIENENTSSMLHEAGLSESSVSQIYQCNNCFTRYDMAFGDVVNGIDKGINFENLEEYVCPVCEAPKKEFSLL
jgi:rubredoxin